MSAICMIWTMVIFLFLIPVTQAAQDYVFVSACPLGSSEWQTEATRKNCQEPTPDYLCAAIENSPGQYGEICTKYGLSPSGTCAVLNEQTHNLDSVPCEAPAGCPDNPYNPGELYNWPICFGDFYGKERTKSTIRTKVYEITTTQLWNITFVAATGETQDGDGGLVTGIVIMVLLIVVGSLVVLCILDRKYNWGLRKAIRNRVTDQFGRLHTQRTESSITRDEEQAKNDDDIGKERLLSSNRGNDFLPPDRFDRLPAHREESAITGGKLNETLDFYEEEQAENGDDIGKERLLSSNTRNDFLPSDTYEEPLSGLKTTTGDGVLVFGGTISQKLTLLQRYLVICLTKYVGIEELKEKIILFKSSLDEHFNEVLLEPLQSLKSLKDYEKIDMLVVYNLLRNVCEHIQPPTRGWDYEPDDTDLGLGADIERVRLMWNRYCDGKTVFDNLDALYGRMQKRYGIPEMQINEEQDVDQCQVLIEKLSPSVQLKPACEVRSGIVTRKQITLVKEILNESGLVICKGAIGCGKTSFLKYFDELYRKFGWAVKWREEMLNSPDVVIKENEKVLLCCDNFFGTYDKCASSATSEIIDVLNYPEKNDQGGELKILLAIHDHVYDGLQSNTSLNILQNKRAVVDLNELTDAEQMLIFKEQRKNGHCTIDLKCWFRRVEFESLKNALKGNSGLIGDPGLTLLYCNHHAIFANKEATLNPLKTLCSLFQNILSVKPDLFNILVFTMFIKTHTFDEEIPDWAAAEPFGLTADDIRENIRHLHGYLDVSVDGRTMKMKHELFSITLFHVCARDPIYLPTLLNHCHFEMIEQLLRPPNTETQADFPITLDETNFQRLISRIIKDNLYAKLKNHPFLQNTKFCSSLKKSCSKDVWKSFFANK
ncbi:uncharacterized protein LOC134255634 [Saccostrea cucullata]|uniref:uncharacterized protein LOC134255634 n=1 Tax=Saccostrea cuccullata TaxID=36930 RepID=UPI002ED3E2FB